MNGNPLQHNGATETIDEDIEEENPEAENVEEPNTPHPTDLPDRTVNDPATSDAPSPTTRRKSSLIVNGQRPETGMDLGASEWAPSKIEGTNDTDASDTASRLDAAVQEREQLRNEVVELRKTLEGIQQKHAGETDTLRKHLEATRAGKDQSESKYNKLLGQVNNIKTQLGERLKADAVRQNNVMI